MKVTDLEHTSISPLPVGMLPSIPNRLDIALMVQSHSQQ